MVLNKEIHDQFIQAKMKFSELLPPQLNEFLRVFQTEQPMVPFLAETLETLLRSFMNMFVLKVLC